MKFIAVAFLLVACSGADPSLLLQPADDAAQPMQDASSDEGVPAVEDGASVQEPDAGVNTSGCTGEPNCGDNSWCWPNCEHAPPPPVDDPSTDPSSVPPNHFQ